MAERNGWQKLPITAGTLVAIGALAVSAFLAGVGVPAWLDQRIDARFDARLNDLEQRVSELERER